MVGVPFLRADVTGTRHDARKPRRCAPRFSTDWHTSATYACPVDIVCRLVMRASGRLPSMVAMRAYTGHTHSYK